MFSKICSFPDCQLEERIDYAGGQDLDTPVAEDSIECANKCGAWPGCTHWSFHEENIGGQSPCDLKNSDEGKPSNTDPSAQPLYPIVSGRKACGRWPMFIYSLKP